MDFFVFVSEQWVLVSILLVLIYLIAITEGVKGGKLLSTSETVQLINSGKAFLLDVREKKDFEEGHIAGALNIPHNKLAERKAELEKHREKLVIITCKLGQTAGVVGKQLRKDGFDVRRIRGGMVEWQNQNLPLVTGNK